METNRVLLYIVVFSSLVLVFKCIRFSPRRTFGWILKAVVVLAITGYCHVEDPSRSGMIGAAFWFGLVLGPSLMQRVVQRYATAERYDRAHQLTSVIRWLHPFDGWWTQPRFFLALELARRGRIDEAGCRLEELAAAENSISTMARVQLFRIRDDWEGLLDWMTRRFSAEAIALDPQMSILHLRALAETGDLIGMLDAFERNRVRLDRLVPALGQVARMIVLAFSGRRDALETILDGRLSGLPSMSRRSWLATADFARGEFETARSEFESLRQSTTDEHRGHFDRRLENPPALVSDVVGAEYDALLDQIERASDHEERFRPKRLVTLRKARATFVLIVVNLAVFALEILFGGSENIETLIRLGAVDVEAVAESGEWWRLFTAGFLHFGNVHLVLNMLALLVLGPFLELSLGRARFLFVFIASSIGAMTAVVVVAIMRDPSRIVVGASGGVLGLVGATGAVLLLGWRREDARPAAFHLRWIILIFGIQMIFDRYSPTVSSEAHIGGAVIGFALGMLVASRR